MSVIAKLRVSTLTTFGTGSFVELGCICSNDLMAAYATSNEDKLFSRYSPWGEIRLNQRAQWSVFAKDQSHVTPPASPEAGAFYAIMLPHEPAMDVDWEKASAYVKINCYEKAKRAGDGSHVELREAYGWAKDTADARDRRAVIEKLSWKMQVDNPPAEEQFVAGRDYWLLFFDAEKFDMHQALAAAHGHVETA